MNHDQMITRGRAHTRLRAELEHQGHLHGHERDTLLAAADALLFDEPEAEQSKQAALELIGALEDSGRRSVGEAGRLRDAIVECGAVLERVEV